MYTYIYIYIYITGRIHTQVITGSDVTNTDIIIQGLEHDK